MSVLIRKLVFWRHAEQGVAAVEFALWAPMLFLIFMGAVELTRYILAYEKAEKAAFTVADNVAQGQTITDTDLSNIVTAAGEIMQPFTFGPNGYVIITSASQTGAYTSSNPPIIQWQYTSSGTTGSWAQASKVGVVGGPATLPNNITLNDKDNVIVAEIFYNFQPILATNGVVGNATVYSVELYKPRLGALTSISALPLFWLIEKGAWL